MDNGAPSSDHNLLLLLELAYKRLDAALMGRLRAAGFPDLRAAHSQVFGAIAPEGSRVGEMAAHAGITQQSMSELVDSLERLGYVERLPDQRDRRAKIVAFTQRGWDCVRVALRTVEELEQEWSGLIGSEQSRAMRAGLEGIARGGHAQASIDSDRIR